MEESFKEIKIFFDKNILPMSKDKPFEQIFPEYERIWKYFFKLRTWVLKAFKEIQFTPSFMSLINTLFHDYILKDIVKDLVQKIFEKEKIDPNYEEVHIRSIVETHPDPKMVLPKEGLNYIEKYKIIEEKKEEKSEYSSYSSYSNTDSSKGSSSSYVSYSERKSTSGYVGLVNQGSTCYLNSLIQSLFFTKAFRRAIFQYRYQEEKKESLCIPLQLQKLFVELKYSDKYAVETKDLTTSFGWSSKEGHVQHDVEELMRVLFGSLEKTSIPLQALYQGISQDRITCLTCKNVGGRKDKFLDLQMVIRNLKHLNESFEQFEFEETLKGDNQFYCEKCQKKSDALKGTKIIDLPDILTLHLKRFDIDYYSENLNYVKLNHPFVFPMKFKKLDQNFNLFAVLIHSGSINNGHYYAYIKTDEDLWYEFNDSHVSKIDISEIEKAFGSETSHSNAYMLMYTKEVPESKETKELLKLKDDDEYLLLPKDLYKDVMKYRIFYEEKEYKISISDNTKFEDSLNNICEEIGVKDKEEFKLYKNRKQVTSLDYSLLILRKDNEIPVKIIDKKERKVVWIKDVNDLLSKYKDKSLLKNKQKITKDTEIEVLDLIYLGDDLLFTCFVGIDKYELPSTKTIKDLKILMKNTDIELLKGEYIVKDSDQLYQYVNECTFNVKKKKDEFDIEIFLFNEIKGEKKEIFENDIIEQDDISMDFDDNTSNDDNTSKSVIPINQPIIQQPIVNHTFPPSHLPPGMPPSHLPSHLPPSAVFGGPMNPVPLNPNPQFIPPPSQINPGFVTAASLMGHGLPPGDDSNQSSKRRKGTENHGGSAAVDPPKPVFIKIMDLTISNSTTCLDLKKMICKRSNEFDYPSMIRVREKILKMDFPGRILKDKEVISKSIPIDQLIKKREIIVQKIKDMEDIQDDDLMIRVTRFYPTENRIGDIKEIKINKKKTDVGDMKLMFAKEYGISLKNIEMVKLPVILSKQVYDMNALKKLKWNVNSKDDDILTQSPYFIEDIDLLICKDANEKIQVIQMDSKEKEKDSSSSNQLKFYNQ